MFTRVLFRFFLVGASWTMASVATAQLTGGLIGYWPFDGSASDESGLGNSLTLFGGATFGPGLIGQGLSLNGNSSQYAGRMVDDSIFDFGIGNFTAQIWGQFNSTVGEQVLMEKFQGGGGPGWTLTKQADNTLHFYSNPSATMYVGSLGINSNQWHQFVIRRNGNQFTLWYDGHAVGTQNTGTPVPNTSFPLIVGKRNSSDGRNFAFNGQLDETAIWSRALSDTEIIQLYNGGLGLSLYGGPGTVESEVLISTGMDWTYLDNGTDQGTAWRSFDFDDSAWSRGPSQLGYGDGDEDTIVDCGPGPVGNCSQANGLSNNYATTYFRIVGELEDGFAANLRGVFARILRDDGAAVYVNGVEVYRDASLRPNALFNELANYNGAGAVGGADENAWISFAIAPALFRDGLNVIAVEVHQQALNSSDVSFDFELTAVVAAIPEPATWVLVVMGFVPILIATNRPRTRWNATIA